jgi:hypothetical protein
MAVKRYNGTAWVVEAGGVPQSTVAFRNILHNGAFAIDQRNAGASQTFTAAAALAYSVDRWYGYCTGANITGARVAGSVADQYYYRFTGAASNTAIGFGQRIEAANSIHFAGQTATLSVSLASTSLTSITWTAYYATTADTFGTLASPTRTSIATGTFTINSTLTRYSANIAVPTAATTGMEIVFTGGALLASQTLTVSNAQFELGASATTFERRPIGAELALCQRYYISESCQINGYVDQAGTPGTVRYFSIWLPVTMRTAPTSGNISGTTASGAASVYGTPSARQISLSRSVGTSSVGTDLTSYVASAEL